MTTTDAFDWSRPALQRYAQAVLALTPTDWERLDAVQRQHWAQLEIIRARQAGHPHPERAVPQPTPEKRGWRKLVSGVMDRGFTHMHDSVLAPAWQRQGTGPARLLWERFQHPYVTRAARVAVELGLTALRGRGTAKPMPAADLARVAEVLNAVLPWDEIWAMGDGAGARRGA